VVRCVLVPAIMALLGKAGWWFPKWLDRVTPNLSIEGEEWFAERDRKSAEDDASQSEPPQVEALPKETPSETSQENPDTQNEPARTD
jgi:RND superfamily putative drug exporter